MLVILYLQLLNLINTNHNSHFCCHYSIYSWLYFSLKRHINSNLIMQRCQIIQNDFSCIFRQIQLKYYTPINQVTTFQIFWSDKIRLNIWHRTPTLRRYWFHSELVTEICIINCIEHEVGYNIRHNYIASWQNGTLMQMLVCILIDINSAFVIKIRFKFHRGKM